MLRDLPIDQISVRADARAVALPTVAALAESIATVGLINPIRVRALGDGWEVVAGVHRLEAHKSLGLVEIACSVVENNDDDAELAMLDENLIREELSPVDRARYMAARKANYLKRHPDGRTSQQLGNPERADRFTLAVAKATGKSEATVQQQVAQGNNILPEVLELIRGTELDQVTYLNKLKSLPGSEQSKVATRDLALERQKNRDQVALARKKKQAADLKARAAKNFAEWLVEKLGPEEADWAVSTLGDAGAANISQELAALTSKQAAA